jgi:hypothetical protein
MRKQSPGLRRVARVLLKKGLPGLLSLTLLAPLAPGAPPPQEATQTAPWAYKLRFENEWVRVTRVHYGPREKIPAHAHPTWPCAYVYLNDAGPVIFRHQGWDHPELTRPATKAGSFRLSPTSAVAEVHEVESLSDTPSDFLRVEFKTEPAGRESLRGRFYREQDPRKASPRRVQFENEQVRITRLVCAPGGSVEVAAGAGKPALFVSLTAARLRTEGAAEPAAVEPGQTVWVSGGGRERFENLGTGPLELLRFDFKTAPAKPARR